MPGSKVGPVPIVQMYGVTMEGNSVLCHIHGFVPYFYVPAPPGFQQRYCSLFQECLNKAVLGDMRSNKDSVTQVSVRHPGLCFLERFKSCFESSWTKRFYHFGKHVILN